MVIVLYNVYYIYIYNLRTRSMSATTTAGINIADQTGQNIVIG